MLQLLPREVFDNVLSYVPTEHIVLSACKELRPVPSKTPTHAKLEQMLLECGLHVSQTSNELANDDPAVLTLFRAWNTPHTRAALIHWVTTQQISIDEGGLYAHVPWRCVLYNPQGWNCMRIRVQLWDRANRRRTYKANQYGGTRTVWELVPGLEDRAYHPSSVQ